MNGRRKSKQRGKPKDKGEQTVLNPFLEVKLGCYLGGDQFRDFIQGLLSKERELSAELVGYKQWRKQRPMAELLRQIAQIRGMRVEELSARSRQHIEGCGDVPLSGDRREAP